MNFIGSFKVDEIFKNLTHFDFIIILGFFKIFFELTQKLKGTSIISQGN